jgi:GDP-4-dehydro-6-deoxy-D-mannose reductase
MCSADGVIHLAAQSNVGVSWQDRRETYTTNFLGTATLLDAVRVVCPEATVLVVGSAEVYGPVPVAEQPIREERALDPRSPYAVSKAAAEMLARQTALADDLRVLATRSFNHTGPGQSAAFVASNFARQVAMIEAGGAPPLLKVGNLEVKRDFSDVRDVCRAYLDLLGRGVAGEVYNVCSGKAVSIGGILEIILGHASVSIEVGVDSSRLRGQDIPLLLGDGGRLTGAIGERTLIPLEQSLLDLLAWWRERTKPA